MQITIKKINVLFLLLPALTPLLFVISFSMQRYIIHHKMRERLEHQLLRTISMRTKDIQWIEKGEEILVDGKMFDISTLEHKDGITIFTGLFDHEETALAQQLEETQKQNPSADNKILGDFFQWLQSVYSENNFFDSPFSRRSSHENSIIVSPLSEQFQVILTPPPQAI